MPKPHLPERFSVRCPGAVAVALRTASRDECAGVSDMLRRLLIEALRQRGYLPAPKPPAPAHCPERA